MEPNQDNLTADTLPDASQLNAPDGQAADADTLSLAELNTFLGKDFKDKDAALKAVKDTFAYVGRKIETASPAPEATTGTSTLEADVRSLREDLFYSQHPEYAEYRSLISSMGNPTEVVEKPEFKTIFEKVKEADQVRTTRSVVASNPRLAQEQTATEEAVRIANATHSTQATVEALIPSLREAAFSQQS